MPFRKMNDEATLNMGKPTTTYFYFTAFNNPHVKITISDYAKIRLGQQDKNCRTMDRFTQHGLHHDCGLH